MFALKSDFVDSDSELANVYQLYNTSQEFFEDVLLGVIAPKEFHYKAYDSSVAEFCKNTNIEYTQICDTTSSEEESSVESDSTKIGTESSAPIDTCIKDSLEEVCEVTEPVAEDIVEEIKPDMMEPQTVTEDSVVNLYEEPKGFLKKLLRKRKQQAEQVQLSLDLGSASESFDSKRLHVDNFRNYIMSLGIISEEDFDKVKDVMLEHKKFKQERYFMETAVSIGLISEERACKIISQYVMKDIKTYDSLDLDATYDLNKLYSVKSIEQNFIYIDVNDKDKCITIGCDLSVKPNVCLIEKRFLGYTVYYKYFLEGTTDRVLRASCA